MLLMLQQKQVRRYVMKYNAVTRSNKISIMLFVGLCEAVKLCLYILESCRLFTTFLFLFFQSMSIKLATIVLCYKSHDGVLC